jgi:hypothetical protein
VIRARLIYLSIGVTLLGCQSPEESSSSQHIGFVEVTPITQQDEAVVGRSVETIGIRIGPGLGIGYFEETRIAFDRDCRLVVLVPNDAALTRLLEGLKHMKQGELCAAVTDLSEN